MPSVGCTKMRRRETQSNMTGKQVKLDNFDACCQETGSDGLGWKGVSSTIKGIHEVNNPICVAASIPVISSSDDHHPTNEVNQNGQETFWFGRTAPRERSDLDEEENNLGGQVKSWSISRTSSRIERRKSAGILSCSRFHFAIFLCLFVFADLSGGRGTEGAVTSTFLPLREGTVKGKVVTVEGGLRVRRFLGIPYGKDSSTYRFGPPQPLTSFQTSETNEEGIATFNAEQSGPACFGDKDNKFKLWPGSNLWNPTQNMSEDCLNLNIWIPYHIESKEKLNILVWIFGGGFYAGSPSLPLYDGAQLAATQRVIVVNINYRLGPFGFLYLNHPSAPGNVGLLDQQLALKWIYQNALKMGGNPEEITIFGESAGSASYARAGGCDLKKMSTSEAIACLRKLPAAEVQTLTLDILDELRVMEFPTAPVTNDGTFFEKDVKELLDEGSVALPVKDCPIIVGQVADEGTFWLTYYLNSSIFHFDPHEDRQAIMSKKQYEIAVNLTLRGYIPKENWKKVADIYLTNAGTLSTSNSSNGQTRYRDAIGRLYGDLFFACDVHRFSQLMTRVTSRKSPVYSYFFSQRSPTNPWPKWMGVMHGYEIEYFFGAPISSPSKYTTADESFSSKMMSTWVNFAKDGTPPPGNTKPWPAFKGESLVNSNKDIQLLKANQIEPYGPIPSNCLQLQKLAICEDCPIRTSMGRPKAIPFFHVNLLFLIPLLVPSLHWFQL